MSESSDLVLSSTEARILGVLVEKHRTVPDAYPLSLNALMLGCNQKTSRDPVMNLDEATVLSALDQLLARRLVSAQAGGRVTRYAHHLGPVLGIPAQSEALLATLLLRGPQTAGELRSNAERLHRFADISTVEAFLEELAARAAGPLVRLLPRAPGAREPRWVHLLCGDPAVGAVGEAEIQPGLEARVAVLEAEVAALRQMLTELRDVLGN
jgi:hypothetical protein